MAKTLKPTSAAQWKDDVAKVITLPSGNTAKLREPSFVLRMLLGTFPPHLLAIGKTVKDEGRDWTPAENDQLLDWLICESFVDPHVTLAEEDGALHIRKLSQRDRMAVASELGLLLYIIAKDESED